MARIEDSRIVCRWPVKRQAGARMSEVSSFSFLSRHAAGPNPQGVSLRRSDRANFPTALLFCRALGFLGIKLLRRPCRHLPLQKSCVMPTRDFLKRLLPLKGLQALRNIRCRSSHFRFFLWSEILRLFRRPSPLIPDGIWYELQFKPLNALKYCGIQVPGLPPDDVQIRFTGRTGQDNLKQAFSFYQYICSARQLNKINSPKILDFGGGWGRIARFF